MSRFISYLYALAMALLLFVQNETLGHKENQAKKLLEDISALLPDEIHGAHNTRAIIQWPADLNQGNVIDNTLMISDTVLPNGPIHVQACSTNVTIWADATVSGAPGGASQLFLEASAGRTITVNVLGDLNFQGSQGKNGNDLLLVFRGQGSVVFQLGDGKSVRFEGNGTDGGGTKAFLVMDQSASGGFPTIQFMRTNCTSAQDVTVEIGRSSVLTFSSAFPLSNSSAQGKINFVPTNSGAGRMIFSIKDKGAFIDAPSTFIPLAGTTPNPCFPVVNLTFANFNLINPAGGFALASIVPATLCSGCSGLLVTDSNKTIGQLLIDPWNNLNTNQGPTFTGTFSGVRYGFIVGANGQLVISNDTFLDFVGLATDLCPDSKKLHVSDRVIKQRNPSALIIDGSYNPLAFDASISLGTNSGLFFRSGVDDCCVVENPVGTPNEFTIDPAELTRGAGNMVFDIEAPLSLFGNNSTDTIDPLSCFAPLETPTSKIEVLSLQVENTGLLVGCGVGCFPQRTFDVDINGEFLRYNSAYIFINNQLTLSRVSLVHSDENHCVIQNNDCKSEPTYVGGDSAFIKKETKPKIRFFNSQLQLHNSAAFTGVDLLVPNGLTSSNPVLCADNTVEFIFYQNGQVCDQGFGRNLVLGTTVGSLACDGATVINRDSHLDVMQIAACNYIGQPHQLYLLTEPNDSCINPCLFQQFGPTKQRGSSRSCSAIDLPAMTLNAIADQFSTQSIFLGHNSNISVGSQNPTPGFSLTSHPTFIIHGNFFAFESGGGTRNAPQSSGSTGTGGIFVDNDGTFKIDPKFRASFGTMVTKSGTGTINLPKRQVIWDTGFGISEWKVDLSDVTRQVAVPGSICTTPPLVEVPIVGAGQHIVDYTLDWLTTKKDLSKFTPYAIGCYDPCCCPPVSCANINALPTINGTVDQLLVRGSRLGDPAHVMVDCGHVREFIYVPGCYAGQAPTSVIVLQHDGSIGLGSAHRNVDSNFASIVLGVNGVSIIANGDGIVTLNEDIIIDNICSILKGPDFNGNTLTFASDCCRTLRVKPGGVLDISQFGSTDIIAFAGNIKLILEPGSKLIFGGHGTAIPGGACSVTPVQGATLSFTDEACMIAEPVTKLDPVCTPAVQCSVQNTDKIRVKIIGMGTIELNGCSCFTINKNAFVGVETLNPASGFNTDGCEVGCTNLIVNINDSAKFLIGDGCQPFGGAFQVGNVCPHTFNCIGSGILQSACVSFTLNINGGTDADFGPDGAFIIDSQGFVGFGVGIADKSSDLPNNWLVDNLFNVKAISISVTNGIFKHDKIYTGDYQLASLLAFGNTCDTVYTFVNNPLDNNICPTPATQTFFATACSCNTLLSESSILGGGNMILLTPAGSSCPGTCICPAVCCLALPGCAVCPSPAGCPRVVATIMASEPFLDCAVIEPSTVCTASGTAADIFNYLALPPLVGVFGFAVAARSNSRNNIRIGYIDVCQIVRADTVNICGPGPATAKQDFSIQSGVVTVGIDASLPAPTCCTTPITCGQCACTGRPPIIVVCPACDCTCGGPVFPTGGGSGGGAGLFEVGNVCTSCTACS